MVSYFVTATGTGVGKTYVTALLCRQLKAQGRSVRALKPVISGFDPENYADSDTALILEALGQLVTAETIESISPWRFRAPLSPDMAAEREGRSIDFAALTAFGRAANEEVLLMEGVGGAMVPLTEAETVMDWMIALGAPALVVAGSYLGTISHTLTTVAAMQNRGITIAGVVVSESEDSPVPLEETVSAIARFLEGITIMPLLRGGSALPDFKI